MAKKPSLLQAAMKSGEGPAEQLPNTTPQVEQQPAPAQERVGKPATTYIAPSRAAKSAKTHYLPKAYWETLEVVSFHTRDENGKRVPQERLVAEALNLLFTKYNYPVVRED